MSVILLIVRKRPTKNTRKYSETDAESRESLNRDTGALNFAGTRSPNCLHSAHWEDEVRAITSLRRKREGLWALFIADNRALVLENNLKTLADTEHHIICTSLVMKHVRYQLAWTPRCSRLLSTPLQAPPQHCHGRPPPSHQRTHRAKLQAFYRLYAN